MDSYLPLEPSGKRERVVSLGSPVIVISFFNQALKACFFNLEFSIPESAHKNYIVLKARMIKWPNSEIVQYNNVNSVTMYLNYNL
jgi:hypothetical protein